MMDFLKEILEESQESKKTQNKEIEVNRQVPAFESQRFSETVKDRFIYIKASDPNLKKEKGIRVLLYKNHKEVCLHLSAKAYYRGISSEEYLVLFYCCDKIIHNKRLNYEQIGILIGITALAGRSLENSSSWTSLSKKISSKVQAITCCIDDCHKEKWDKNLQRLLPGNGLSQSGNYFRIEEYSRSYPTSSEVRRIGVGYKDKGGLSPPHVTKETRDSWPGPSPIPLTISEILSSVMDCYPFLDFILK